MKCLKASSAVVLCIAGLTACSSNAVSDPSEWSCESLIQPVVEMSQDRSPTILEITDPEERTRRYGPNPSIECIASAEWSQGQGDIKYGAHVSDGGNVILEYEQW